MYLIDSIYTSNKLQKKIAVITAHAQIKQVIVSKVTAQRENRFTNLPLIHTIHNPILSRRIDFFL